MKLPVYLLKNDDYSTENDDSSIGNDDSSTENDDSSTENDDYCSGQHNISHIIYHFAPVLLAYFMTQ